MTALPDLVLLLACHNRCEQTRACLIAACVALGDRRDWAVVLADDGCRDGTVAMAQDLLGERLTVVRGKGDWFWNRSMRAAWMEARRLHPEADVVWLNDDVVVDAQAFATLARIAKLEGEPVGLAVGALADPDNGTLTYGGHVRRNRLRPLAFTPVWPNATVQLCDTCNGNLVYIPSAVVARVGLLDPAFHHGMGDYDYGLRATRLGIPCRLAPGFLGTCSHNHSQAGTWVDRSLGRWQRLQLVCGIKGLPPRPWFRFAWRHGGLLGLAHACWPYVKILLGR